MKKTILLLFLMILGNLANATNIPNELLDIIPAGGHSIQLKGVSSNGRDCVVDFSHSSLGFTISAISGAKVANLQIGLGHELQNFESSSNQLTVITYHEAEEQYSRDTRSTAIIEKDENGSFQSVSIKVEQKGLLWGWSTDAHIVCTFDNN